MGIDEERSLPGLPEPVEARQGVLDLDSLVTQRFALDEINEAVDALENGRIAGRSILVFD